MNPLVSPVTTVLSYLSLVGNALIVVFLVFLFLKKNRLKNFFQENSILFAFIIASIATLGSLFFSEVAGYIPCMLCWYQRIFMYPQVIILGVALVTNDNKVYKYVLPLSLIGGLIGIYHYALQTFPTVLPCTDEVAKCSARDAATFGFITIPYMSATAFILISLSMVILLRSRRS